MIIQPLDCLLEKGNKIKANAKRISLIRENLLNNKYKSDTLCRFVKSLELANVDELHNVISLCMFYEEINRELIVDLCNTYANARNKEQLIKDLCISYEIKATMGIIRAWYPVVAKHQSPN